MTEPHLKKQQKQTANSATRVNYPQSVFSGVRKTKGFKCDTGLYEEFKRVAQAKMGSVCRPLECFMVAFLALNKEVVNFGETVRIENLQIERNLRPRRKLDADVCGFRGCNNPVVAIGVWKGKKKLPLCDKHRQEAESKPEQWKIIHLCNSLEEERLLP